MKRFLCLTLAVLLALGLLACGGNAEKEEGKAEKPAWAGQFAVGYGRADVTPDHSVGMRGFGDVRQSTGVLNKLYITCIAVTDETDNTVLLYTFDCKNMGEAKLRTIREAVAAKTEIPVEKIFIGATHTHSSPDAIEEYVTFSAEKAVLAAQDALADRDVATIEYAAGDVPNMTFVRHYVTNKGNVVGDNFYPDGAGSRVKHTTEADKQMRIIRVNREGKKPIVMVNWMGHASTASSSWTEFGKIHRNYLTSDYIGACREYVESKLDCNFAMFMGASGNLNVVGALDGENKGITTPQYAEKLGNSVLSILETMTAGTTGKVSVETGKLESQYGPLSVNAIGFGSIGIITGSMEMFDTTSMAIREKSPYDITFVMTLTNGSAGYMPTKECFGYPNCYEVREGGFFEGSAEQAVEIYSDLLAKTKG